MALVVFHKMTNLLITQNNIGQIESTFLATYGGLTYFKAGNYERVYSLDRNSFYPSIMTSTEQFPIKAGNVKKILEIPHNKLGIYRLKILGTHELFKIHKDNLYTTYDIRHLDLLKLSYELIQDNGPNSITWDMETESASI